MITTYPEVTETLPNGHTIPYRVVNGTAYHLEAEVQLAEILERVRATKERVTFLYGNPETGESWGDQVTGTIGRSTGNIQIPLVIKTSRSLGGEALLVGNILEVRASKGKRILYRHPNAK